MKQRPCSPAAHWNIPKHMHKFTLQTVTTITSTYTINNTTYLLNSSFYQMCCESDSLCGNYITIHIFNHTCEIKI